jgi:hypothetical protein
MNWIPQSWIPDDATQVEKARELRIVSVGQIEGPDKFAVRLSGNCLNRRGEWEYEPSPSNRDEAFMRRCRFKTFEDAASRATDAVKLLRMGERR